MQACLFVQSVQIFWVFDNEMKMTFFVLVKMKKKYIGQKPLSFHSKEITGDHNIRSHYWRPLEKDRYHPTICSNILRYLFLSDLWYFLISGTKDYTAYFWLTKDKRLHEDRLHEEDQINQLIVLQQDNLRHSLAGEFPLILPV